jgi:hypothetical protein
MRSWLMLSATYCNLIRPYFHNITISNYIKIQFIWLMLSVSFCPKTIKLSGFHCIRTFLILQFANPSRLSLYPSAPAIPPPPQQVYYGGSIPPRGTTPSTQTPSQPQYVTKPRLDLNAI